MGCEEVGGGEEEEGRSKEGAVEGAVEGGHFAPWAGIDYAKIGEEACVGWWEVKMKWNFLKW